MSKKVEENWKDFLHRLLTEPTDFSKIPKSMPPALPSMKQLKRILEIMHQTEQPSDQEIDEAFDAMRNAEVVDLTEEDKK